MILAYIYKSREKNSKLNRKREAAMVHKDIAQMGILPFKLHSPVSNTISNTNLKSTFNQFYGTCKPVLRKTYYL